MAKHVSEMAKRDSDVIKNVLNTTSRKAIHDGTTAGHSAKMVIGDKSGHGFESDRGTLG